jgi:two-component system, NarL family, sensor histidine kinase UhpB
MAVLRPPEASFRCVRSAERGRGKRAASRDALVAMFVQCSGRSTTGAVIPTKYDLGTTPFAWRIFAVNAVLLVAAAVALAFSPATVSFPIALTEGIVLAGGLVAILTANLLLVRRSFTPLARLTKLMHSVDLLRPGQRVDVTGPREVRELGAVFNDMLERLERERHESGWDALKAQESERKRVAQELHDEVGQALTAVMLQLGRLAKNAPSDLGDQLMEALETTRTSLDDVRRIAKQLRPEALDDLGLVPALNALASGFAERTGLRIRRRLPDSLPPIGDEAELVVFRVAQESLTNAARHAEATRVDLTLERYRSAIVLHVRDYGRGIDGSHAGSGIRGMRERALLIGGELTISDAVGGGTEVSLSLPVLESP